MGIRIEVDGSDLCCYLGTDLNACLMWAVGTLGEEITLWAVYYPVGFDW